MPCRLLDELLEDSSQESEVEELVGAVFDEIGLELDSQVLFCLFTTSFHLLLFLHL